MNLYMDTYNLRARLSVGIILLSPILLGLYLQIEAVRNLSTTAVMTLALIAISNIIVVMTRLVGKKASNKIKQRRVYVRDCFKQMNRYSRERICTNLIAVTPLFATLENEPETEQDAVEYDRILDSAIDIIEERTRNLKIVVDENITYGFCRNMLGVKKWGILLALALYALEFGLIQYDSLQYGNPEMVITILINTAYLCMWLFLVNANLVEFSANNYAEAILKAAGSISFCTSNGEPSDND